MEDAGDGWQKATTFKHEAHQYCLTISEFDHIASPHSRSHLFSTRFFIRKLHKIDQTHDLLA